MLTHILADVAGEQDSGAHILVELLDSRGRIHDIPVNPQEKLLLADLADNHVAGMNPHAEVGNDAVIVFIILPAGLQAVDQRVIGTRHPVALEQRPEHHQPVARVIHDIAAIDTAGMTGVENEVRDQLHAFLGCQPLSRGRRTDHVEKHDDAFFLLGPVVGAEQEVKDVLLADHVDDLENTDRQRWNADRDSKTLLEQRRMHACHPGLAKINKAGQRTRASNCQRHEGEIINKLPGRVELADAVAEHAAPDLEIDQPEKRVERPERHGNFHVAHEGDVLQPRHVADDDQEEKENQQVFRVGEKRESADDNGFAPVDVPGVLPRPYALIRKRPRRDVERSQEDKTENDIGCSGFHRYVARNCAEDSAINQHITCGDLWL